MDRLPTLIAALAVAVVACNDGDSASKSSRQRVNTAPAEPATKVDPAGMCDRYYPPGKGPAFSWPALTSPAPKADGWRWVNVWATWCAPCVEELPQLVGWQKKLASAGAGTDLVLVSADESADEIASFRAKHPKTPPSLRLQDPDIMPAWIEQLGVKGATLPVQIFVDPRGQVRCVRASAVEQSDYPAIEALVRQGS